MKKNMINTTHIEGYLYQHTLEMKVSGPTAANPNVQYITGNVEIATDEAMTNIVPVHFTYVTATTSKGKANATFTTLSNIIEGNIPCAMKVGKDSAAKLRIDSAIGLNEFFSDRNGEEELVSVKRNEGGFIHTTNELAEDENTRNTFKCDMVITKAIRFDANEERSIPERVIVSGVIFDFRKAILPVEFTVTSAGGMNYFENLGASAENPVFTCVWGRQISETIVKTITEESAFGEASVREVRSSRKSFNITGTSKETYAWDCEDTILASELIEAMTNRETYLATLKQRSDEYKASQAQVAAAPVPANKAFNF